MARIYGKYLNYMQKEAYKVAGLDLSYTQVLKGMIAYFAQIYFNGLRDVLGYAIYRYSGAKLGQR